MKLTSIAVASLLAASVVTPAVAGQNELMLIGNLAANDSQYFMLSYRRSIGDSGWSVRSDLSRASFATDYDATPGTGTNNSAKLLLSYANEIGSASTVTVTGGLSYGTRTVTPVTFSSPADSDSTGYFASAELYSASANGNDFHALVEYDSTYETIYAGSTYELDLGSFKAGPTLNYLVEGDYTRTAAGLSASYDLSATTEVKATAAWAEQVIGANPATDASYLELQVRVTF